MSAVDTISSLIDKLNKLQELAPETPVDRIEYNDNAVREGQPTEESSEPVEANAPSATLTAIELPLPSENEQTDAMSAFPANARGTLSMSISYTSKDDTNVSKTFTDCQEFLKAACAVRKNPNIKSYSISSSETMSDATSGSQMASPIPPSPPLS